MSSHKRIKLNDELIKRHRTNSNIDSNSNTIELKHKSRPKTHPLQLLACLFPETQHITQRDKQLQLAHDELLHWITSESQLNYSYAQLCYIRDWIAKQRDTYCPTTSYDNYQRSTKTLIDLTAGIGSMICCAARKSDRYTNLIANESTHNSILLHALQHNIIEYNYKHVVTTNDDFITFFQLYYITHTPNAVIYIDFTYSDSKLMTPSVTSMYNEQHDKIINYTWDTSYANDPHTLLELVESLLSGTLFMTGNTICPMMCIRVHQKFDVTVLDVLKTRKTIVMNNAEANKLLRTEFHSSIIALVGWENAADIALRLQTEYKLQQNNTDEKNDGSTDITTKFNTYDSEVYIAPSTEYQLHSVIKLYNQPDSPYFHLFLRLKQIISGQLYGCDKQAANMLQYLIDTITHAEQHNEPYTDELLYNKLHDYYIHTVQQSSEYIQQQAKESKSKWRAYNRTVPILQLLGKSPPKYRNPYITAHPPYNISVDSLLDVGCSEGSITAAVGESLHLPVSNIHGCDIREIADTTGFIFRLQTNSNQLPYPDNSMSLILCLMSLHHFNNINKLMSEIYRVLKSDGYLIIREHDLYPNELALILDIQHGLYARVWSIEQTSFCNNYTAMYAPREYWSAQLYQHQLYPCTWSHDQMTLEPPRPVSSIRDRIKNPFNQYWGIYSKQYMEPPPPPDMTQIQQYNNRGRGNYQGGLSSNNNTSNTTDYTNQSAVPQFNQPSVHASTAGSKSRVDSDIPNEFAEDEIKTQTSFTSDMYAF